MERRFLVDVMLGKLTTYLRLCGYDTRYANEEELDADRAIRKRAETTGRTLLTRDQTLAAQTEGAICLTATAIENQLTELHEQGVPIDLPTTPKRCSLCNGSVTQIDSSQHPNHAPDTEERIWQCTDCDQHFWKGSHWERVQETITAVAT